MSTQTTETTELEGTWEEIVAQSAGLAGRQVRVIVLPVEANSQEEAEAESKEPRHGTLGALLKHAGTWQGDDLEECLQAVYENRTKAEFD